MKQEPKRPSWWRRSIDYIFSAGDVTDWIFVFSLVFAFFMTIAVTAQITWNIAEKEISEDAYNRGWIQGREDGGH